MNTKKRLLCLFLIICIAVSLFPASALAADNDAYTSLSAVSSAVREAMIQRKAECTVTCNFSGYSSYDSLCHAIIDSAMAYTGRPDGGDYILYNLESWSYTYYGSTYSIPARLKFNFKYYTTDAQERDVTSRVNSVISSFGFTNDTSDYTKVSTIYNYITSHVTYDQTNYSSSNYDLKYTAYAALLNGTAVCQGYSLLLYRMLLECGVPCRIISGCGNNDSHSWNIIKLGNVWYNADATWDTGRNPYIYFLRGDTVACFPNHVRDNKFATSGFYSEYPMSDISYRSSDDVGLNLNVACPDFSMPSIDGGTVSKNSIAGKPAILVFYGDSCAVSKDVVRNLSNASWARTDKINIIAASFSDMSSVTSYRSTYASGNSYIRFCYGQEATSSLFTLLNACGYTDSTVNTPVCYVLDKYGNIKFQSIGDVDISAFKLYLNGMESSDVGIPKLASTGYMNTTGKPYFDLRAVIGAVSYKIYRSGSANGTYKLIGATDGSRYIDNTAKSGYAYYYKVKAVDASGLTGNYSDAYLLRCHCPAPTVKDDYLTSTGKPYLKWNAVAAACGYEIYRSGSKTGTYTKIGTTTATSYTDTTAATGYGYYYKVKAVCSVSTAGNSCFSEAVFARCHCSKPTVSPEYLTSTGKPYLKWNAVTAASGYEVYRSGSLNGTYTKIGTTTTTSFADKTAGVGYAYYYKVKAISSVSSAGNSYYSDPVAARCHCAKPAVSITLSDGHPHLSWSAVAGASKYDIYRSTDGKSFVKFTSCTDTSWLNSSASSGTTYYYKIIAVSRVSSSANSVYSNAVYIRAK